MLNLAHLGHRISDIDEALIRIAACDDHVDVFRSVLENLYYYVRVQPIERHGIGGLIEDHEVVVA